MDGSEHGVPASERAARDPVLDELRRRLGGRLRFDVLGWSLVWGAVAALLRLPGLARSLWHDEIISLTMFARGGTLDLFTYYPFPNNHILHTLLMKVMLLFGEQEWLLRMPAYLAGVVAVPLLFQLGFRFFNARVGHLAALFLAVCPLHIAYSLSARGYTLVLLGGILAVDGFWSWLIYPRQVRPAMVWKAIGGTLLATWSVPGAVWLIVGLVGAGAWTALPQARSLQGRRWLAKCALYTAAVVPLSGIFYLGVLRSMAAYAREKASAEPAYLGEILKHAAALPEILFRGWPAWLMVLLMVAGLIACMDYRGRLLAGRTLFLCWLAALVPAPLLTPGTPPRLFIYLLPLSFLLIAAALDALSRSDPPFFWTVRLSDPVRRWTSRGWLLGPLLACVALMGLLIEVYPRPTGWVTEGVEEDWHAAARLLTVDCPTDRLPMAWAVEKRLGSVHAGMGYYLDRYWTPDFRDAKREGPRRLLMDLQEGRDTSLKLRLGLFRDIWKPDPGPEWDLAFLQQMAPWVRITQRFDLEVARIYDLELLLPAAPDPESLFSISPSAWVGRATGQLPMSESEEVEMQEPEADRQFIPMLGSFLHVQSEGPSSKAFLVPDLILVPDGHQFLGAWALVEVSPEELDYWVPEEILRPRRDHPKLFGRRLTDPEPPPLNRLELTVFNESRNYPCRAQVRVEVEPRFYLYLTWSLVREHERLTPIFLFSAGDSGFDASLCEFRTWTSPGPGSTTSNDQEYPIQ